MVTVGVLYVVAAGMKQSGALAFLVSRAMGRPKTARAAQARMLIPVTIGSAFLNNTPLVAMPLSPRGPFSPRGQPSCHPCPGISQRVSDFVMSR